MCTYIQKHSYAHRDECTHPNTKHIHRDFIKHEIKEPGFALAKSVKEIRIFEKLPSTKLPQLVNLLLLKISDIIETTYALVCVSDLGIPQQFALIKV